MAAVSIGIAIAGTALVAGRKEEKTLDKTVVHGTAKKI